MSHSFRALLLGVVLLSVAVFGCRSSVSSAADKPLEVGVPAPAYVAVSTSGDSITLGAQRGNVVLLNAWATWCAPCRVEIPEIRALHAKYSPQGLRVIGVSLDEDTTAALVRDFVKEYQMTYQIWRDPGQRFSTDFKFGGLPMTVLIDRAGTLRWLRMGKLESRDTTLDAAIRKALVM